MTKNSTFLGIDGGGTGCRVVLTDGQGHELARAEGGPANIASAPEEALGNLLETCRAAVAQVTAPDAVEATLARLNAGLGLAGANAAGAADWLAARLPFARSRIVSDAITTVKGALGSHDGIVAALGTGSVFARQHQGQITQIGGWGLALGDEGSGAVLGRALMARALRAHDGVLPMTPLLRHVLDCFGTTDALVAFSLTAKGADYAPLAPEISTSDDPAARAIMDHAVAEVRATIAALQPSTAPLPVTYVGGLGPTYAARITDWPERAAQGTALDGALLLAMEGA
jgi:glucosamine kinase